MLKTVILYYLICDKCFNVKKGVCDISKNLLYVILFAEEQKYARFPLPKAKPASGVATWYLSVPNPVTATLHGEDGQVPGVPVASLAADSSLMNAIFDSDKGEKHISLVGVEADVISSYVSLLFKGRQLKLNQNR